MTFAICMNPEATRYKKLVTEAYCASCPVRDAVVVSPYRSLWPTCDLRKKESRTEPCGCKYEIKICDDPRSEHCGSEVRPKHCKACPLIQLLEKVDA